MTAADLERIAEDVRKERDRVYTELMDLADEVKHGGSVALRLEERSKEKLWEDLRAEYKSLRLSASRAKEREEKEAAGGSENPAGRAGGAANTTTRGNHATDERPAP